MFGKKSSEAEGRPAANPEEASPASIDEGSWETAESSVSPERGQSRKAVAKEQEPSVISQAVRMEGTIVSTGPLHLHCDMTGDVTAPFVLVGATGKAKGTLRVDEINVEGSLEGEVSCKLLKAGRNAVVHGDITSENMEVALGATVSGNLMVGRSSET